MGQNYGEDLDLPVCPQSKVINMLEQIGSEDKVAEFVAGVKAKKARVRLQRRSAQSASAVLASFFHLFVFLVFRRVYASWASAIVSTRIMLLGTRGGHVSRVVVYFHLRIPEPGL